MYCEGSLHTATKMKLLIFALVKASFNYYKVRTRFWMRMWLISWTKGTENHLLSLKLQSVLMQLRDWVAGLFEPQNHQGWERPSRSSSPIDTLAPLKSPLNYIPKCHIQVPVKLFQRQWLPPPGAAYLNA